MTSIECDMLSEIAHAKSIVLQSRNGDSYKATLYFDAEQLWHYARINAYLEIERKFFYDQNIAYHVPKVEIPCQNCNDVFVQMLHLQKDEVDEDFQSKLMMDLMIKSMSNA